MGRALGLPLLLVVVAVIGLVLAKWLGHPPPPVAPEPPRQAATREPPQVPTRPQDLKQFEQDINHFMQDAAKQRGREEP